MASDPKDLLRVLAEDISAIMEQDRGALVPIISPEAGQWFVSAVRSNALSIKKGKGRPRQSKDEQESSRTRRMAKAAFLIKRKYPQKTFAQIAADIDAQDGEWLRKAHNQYEAEFKTEAVTAAVLAKLRRPERRKK